MKDLVCKNCGAPRKTGRRLCIECDKQRKRENSKEIYIKNGRKYLKLDFCKICGKEIKIYKEDSTLMCKDCYLETRRTGNKSTNKYIFVDNKSCHLHRKIMEDFIGRKLSFNEVVHHIDGNVKNNSIDNLVLMSRSEHSKLHFYLNKIKSTNFKEDYEFWIYLIKCSGIPKE